jgi:hypothetical protein
MTSTDVRPTHRKVLELPAEVEGVGVTVYSSLALICHTLRATCNCLSLWSVGSAPPFPVLHTFVVFVDTFAEVTLHFFPVPWMSRS